VPFSLWKFSVLHGQPDILEMGNIRHRIHKIGYLQPNVSKDK
jgi:hypothetical protein